MKVLHVSLLLCILALPMLSSMDTHGFYPPEEAGPPAATRTPIIPIDHPSKLLPIFERYLKTGRPILGVFDIDHTLGDCTDQRLHESAYGRNVSIRLTIVPQSQHIDPYANIFKDHYELMKETRMKPLSCDPENTISKLIKHLYARGVLFMGSTSRSTPYRDITYRHLKKDLDINFDQTLERIGKSGLEVSFDISPPATFTHAIAHCGGNSKARVARLVLPLLGLDNPIIIVVDDKSCHLETMYKEFGEQVVPVHLNTPEEPIRLPALQSLLPEALRLPRDVQLELTQRPFQTLKLFIHKAEDREQLIQALFDQLIFPKSKQLSKEEVDRLVESYLGAEVSQEAKINIASVLSALQKRIKQRAPLFKFLASAGKDYLAIYTGKQDGNHHLITHDGNIAYNDPILFPVELLYKCNKRLLEKKLEQEDLPHHAPVRRTLSYLDLPDSPPSTPGPTSPGMIRSGIFSPKSPQ